jgi:hypothetical protein
MRFSKPVVFLINALIASIGVILLFVGLVFVTNSVGKELLLAIGTSLIAAGLINSLDRFISVEAPMNPGIRMVTSKRKDLPPEFHDRKYHTDKFDLVAVAVKDCLKELADDHQNKMVNRILFHGVRFRIIFVHPDSPFLKQRANEDGMDDVSDIIKLQKESVRYTVLFYKKLNEAYENEKSHLDHNKIGNVTIRLIDINPYLTIERFGNEINWGLYTSDTDGKNCAMFSVMDRVDDEQSEVFDQFRKHFSALLQKAPGNLLLTLVNGQAPSLNRDLADSILTKSVVDKLLK